jgi:hypothetical protein
MAALAEWFWRATGFVFQSGIPRRRRNEI